MSSEVKNLYVNPMNNDENLTKLKENDKEEKEKAEIKSEGEEDLTEESEIIAEHKLIAESKKETFYPRLRYFAVGPKVRHIKCPLCKVRDTTYEVHPNTFKQELSSYLSCLSCCFPIFWIFFCMYCMDSNGCIRRERQACSNCGAQVGLYFRPS